MGALRFHAPRGAGQRVGALAACAALVVCLLHARVAVAVLSKEPMEGLSVDLTRSTEMHAWTVGGSASKVDDVVRLTPDEQSKRGWLWTQRAEATSAMGNEWRIDLSFRVSGKGVTLFGDGLALWYSKAPYAAPRDGGAAAFGHDATFKGVGVFFDTYDNDAGDHMHKHPYVHAMVSDGSKPYHHDVMAGTEDHPALGCHARIRQYGIDQKITTARLAYSAKSRVLTLKLLFTRDRSFRHRPDYEWTECFRLEDVHIPSGYYVGATASTGDLSDNHDVLALEVFGMAGAEPSRDPAADPYDVPYIGAPKAAAAMAMALRRAQ